MQLQQQDIYFPVLNLTVRECVDLLLGPIFDSIGHPLYPVVQLAVLAFGCIFAARAFGLSRLPSTVAALLGGTCCLIAVGLDPVLLQVHWFPWMLGAFILLVRTDTFVARLLAPSTMVLWVCSAGSQSVFGLLIILLVCVWFSTRCGTIGSYVTGSGVGTVRWAAPMLLGGIVCCLGLMPIAPLPDYPPGAQVVPQLKSAFSLRPLLGGYQSMQSIEAGGFNQSYAQHASGSLLAVALLAYAVFLSLRWNRPESRFRAGIILAPLVLLVVLIVGDYPVTKSNPDLTPFMLLSTVVPGLAVTPIVWSVAPVLIVTTIVLLCADLTPRLAAAFAGISLIAGALALLHRPEQPFMVSKIDAPPSAIRSISGYIVQTRGAWTAHPDAAAMHASDRFERIALNAGGSWSAEATIESADAVRVIDGSDYTSWKTKRGQLAGDALRINFPQPLPIARAVLMTKRSRGKFPEGVEVLFCDRDGRWHSLVEHVPWAGPIRFTVRGFPYFGSRDHVILDFPEQVDATGLLFVVTNDSERSWGVDELRLYSLK